MPIRSTTPNWILHSLGRLKLGPVVFGAVLALAFLLISGTSRASEPSVFIGTAPAIADYGEHTHIKFVTVTVYDQQYTAGQHNVPVKVFHAWAPSNNEVRPGVPLNDPSRPYRNATYRDGTPVPNPVEGNGGHLRIEMDLLKAITPELVAMDKAWTNDDGSFKRMKTGKEFNYVARAGGLTVDADGNVAHVATKSSVNLMLTEHIYGQASEDAHGNKVDNRGLPPAEAEIYKEQLKSVLEGSPCECFVSGTPIATEKGARPIESIQEGDRIWAMGDKGKPELHKVLHTMHDPPRETRFVTLSTEGQRERLETTDEHPFFVVGLGWTKAENLKAGNTIVTREGHTSSVIDTEVTNRSEPTFNFEVEGVHNYFVGKSQALVHNACAVARASNRAGRMTRFQRLGNLHMGSGTGAITGLLANFLASYAGQSIAGEAGALGAAFGAAAITSRIGGNSWRMSAGSAGASIGASFLTSWALRSAGVENRWIHTGAGITTGALVDGAIAYGTWSAAAGGTAAGAAGTAMLSSGLWGVLAAEVVYHASQWYEIYQLNVNAANGDPAAQDALNEITFGGWLSPYSPQTYLLYGAYSWVTRPGEVLTDLWRHGL